MAFLIPLVSILSGNTSKVMSEKCDIKTARLDEAIEQKLMSCPTGDIKFFENLDFGMDNLLSFYHSIKLCTCYG